MIGLVSDAHGNVFGLQRCLKLLEESAAERLFFLGDALGYFSKPKEVLELLKMNGGNSSGEGIACISWDGSVYADQFWRQHSFGNILSRPFQEIWTDLTNPLMAQLKDKKRHVKGRCAKCRWIDICGGNFRARAEAVSGDIWGEDPACYLTDKEIGLD